VKKEILTKLLVAVTPFVMVGLVFFGINAFHTAQTKTFYDSAHGIVFQYSPDLGEATLTDQQKKDRYIVRLLPQQSSKYSLEIELRYEDQLRRVSALTHTDLLDMLVSNATKAFAREYKGYKKVSEKQVTINEKKGSELQFTYTGPKNELIYQRFLILIRDPDTAYYLSAQTIEQDFDAVNRRYFERIFSSTEFR